jgi:hypothetical protein
MTLTERQAIERKLAQLGETIDKLSASQLAGREEIARLRGGLRTIAERAHSPHTHCDCEVCEIAGLAAMILSKEST